MGAVLLPGLLLYRMLFAANSSVHSLNYCQVDCLAYSLV
jgi:hypothetical protein